MNIWSFGAMEGHRTIWLLVLVLCLGLAHGRKLRGQELQVHYDWDYPMAQTHTESIINGWCIYKIRLSRNKILHKLLILYCRSNQFTVIVNYFTWIINYVTWTFVKLISCQLNIICLFNLFDGVNFFLLRPEDDYSNHNLNTEILLREINRSYRLDRVKMDFFFQHN